MNTQNVTRFIAAILVLCGVTLILVPQFVAASPPAQTNSFTFTAVGDLGGSANTDAVLNGIANAGADFQFTLGDLSYGSYAPETAWCNYVQGKVGATFPFELGAGNHDMDAQPTGHINNFVACLPDRIGNLTGAYGKEYYFDYKNLARFIYISPNLTLDGTSYSYTVGSARYSWLSNAIDGARSANMPWVIVGMHKNCITVGAKECEIGAPLLNLLVSKKVDLILQGHDHTYQRSKQLAHNANCSALVPLQYDAACVADHGADNMYAKGAGSVITIVGTGGKSLYASNPFDTEAGYFARYVNPGVETARYGFLKVNVTAAQLSAQFIGTSGGSTFSDAYTITSAPGTNTPTRTSTRTPTPKPTPTRVALIARASYWKYLDNGTNQGTAWRARTFYDSTWKLGQAQLGYGDGDEKTIIRYGKDPNNKHITTYFRKHFTVTHPAQFRKLTLRLLRDDGAVVYLNGREIARSNMPAGTILHTTRAASAVGDTAEKTFYLFYPSASLLRTGDNVLAVEVHQVLPTSSDVSFNLALLAQ